MENDRRVSRQSHVRTKRKLESFEFNFGYWDVDLI